MSQKMHSEIALRAVSAVGLIAVILYALMWWGTFVFFLTALTGGILYEVLKVASFEPGTRNTIALFLAGAQAVLLLPGCAWCLGVGFIVFAGTYLIKEFLVNQKTFDRKRFLFVLASTIYIFLALYALGRLYLEGINSVWVGSSSLESNLTWIGFFFIFGVCDLVFSIWEQRKVNKSDPRFQKLWLYFWVIIAVLSVGIAIAKLDLGRIMTAAAVVLGSHINDKKICSINLFVHISAIFGVFTILNSVQFLQIKEWEPLEGLLYAGGRFRILGLFLIVWLTDTGAFLVGRLLGGPKLAPRLSPGKTWSGFFGGTLLASGLCTLATTFSPYPLFPVIGPATPWFVTFALTAILSVAAHAGDLLESAVKRHLGVKDMGTLIPGHGGLADRFDSLLLVSLIAFLIQQAFRFL